MRIAQKAVCSRAQRAESPSMQKAMVAVIKQLEKALGQLQIRNRSATLHRGVRWL